MWGCPLLIFRHFYSSSVQSPNKPQHLDVSTCPIAATPQIRLSIWPPPPHVTQCKHVVTHHEPLLQHKTRLTPRTRLTPEQVALLLNLECKKIKSNHVFRLLKPWGAPRPRIRFPLIHKPPHFRISTFRPDSRPSGQRAATSLHFYTSPVFPPSASHNMSTCLQNRWIPPIPLPRPAPPPSLCMSNDKFANKPGETRPRLVWERIQGIVRVSPKTESRRDLVWEWIRGRIWAWLGPRTRVGSRPHEEFKMEHPLAAPPQRITCA